MKLRTEKRIAPCRDAIILKTSSPTTSGAIAYKKGAYIFTESKNVYYCTIPCGVSIFDCVAILFYHVCSEISIVF